MTGSSLAPLIIPIAGTLFLSAWLALVFYFDHRPCRADSHTAPGCEGPGGGHKIEVPAAALPQGDLRAALAETGDLRVIFEVER